MTTLSQPVVAAVSSPPQDGEHRVLLNGVDWRTYCAVRELIDSPGVRMAFFEGVLEIMTPSRRHEAYKTQIARLLETYALERDVRLYGYGSTTFRDELRDTGLEPDECYVVGRQMDAYPDLAIEVALSSGGLPKLALYERLKVREVWFWTNDGLRLYGLTPGGYEPLARSSVLAELDLELLASFVRHEDQHEAVKGYREALRSAR
jgi:Uma2 family endonuclease